MSTKTLTKIVVALSIVATICLAISSVFAVTISIPEAAQDGVTTGLTGTTNNVLGVVTYVCYAAAIIMLVVLGVKYITASPDGKAEIKKTAVQYVIGAVLVFAAGTVIKIIQTVATSSATNA